MDKEQCIAVTGGTGLIGSYLLRYLVQEGYGNIRASRRPGSRLDLVHPVADQIEWMEGDIMDITFLDSFCHEADIVVHAAAVVSFNNNERRHLMDANIKGTANVVNSCLAADNPTLIHISSTSALGPSTDGSPIDERTEWKKDKLDTPYAKSKFRAELEAFRGYAEGLDVRVINPPIVLGSGFWERSSSNLFPKIAKGIPIYPKGSTGFVDVRDLAEMIEKVMRKGQSGERYICCGGHLAYEQLMRLTAEELQRRSPSWPLRSWMIPLVALYFRIAGIFGERGSSVTRQSLSIAQRDLRFDNTKSIESLDMQYRPLRETIREVARQYKRSAVDDIEFDRLPFD